MAGKILEFNAMMMQVGSWWNQAARTYVASRSGATGGWLFAIRYPLVAKADP